MEVNLQELERKFLADNRILDVEYATKNNPYKVGDKIQDHWQYIQIQSIHYGGLNGSNGLPVCVYKGIRLKKDGTPFKSGENSNMYQSNIKTQ